MKLPVEAALHRASALDEGPLLKMYRTDAAAMAALVQLEELQTDIVAAEI